MIIKFTLLLILFISVTAATNEAELKVKGGSSSSTNTTEILVQTKGGLNRKVGGGSGLDLDNNNVDLSSKGGKGHVSDGGEGQRVQKSDLDKKPDFSKNHIVEAASNVGKESSGKKVGTKVGQVEESGDKGNDKEVFPAARKENEECGLPDRCTAENDALVACLRVPGNESPDLALLIQNKGKGPLDVKIIAPNFVSLEKQQIHLEENKHERVKVTVKNGGTDNSIILTAGNSNCTLSFKDLITQNLREEAVHTSQFNRFTYFNWTTAVVFIILTALLLLASVWTCISFRRRHYPSSSTKYQKLDMELPVSNGVRVDTELNAGWDDSWGDSWDDEEAPKTPKTPKTPSMPITPSLSSQGVSSRRINKDGWKD